MKFTSQKNQRRLLAQSKAIQKGFNLKPPAPGFVYHFQSAMPDNIVEQKPLVKPRIVHRQILSHNKALLENRRLKKAYLDYTSEQERLANEEGGIHAP